ncbi:hemolysin family protein [Cryptosporangium arvum]|uniref:CBS domain-containing protein n=1 Tax=Cryptosporangium arvum DSM 44712 TaxID=927661 RepID=A0A010ZS12_9ACTN|nr:hemolysin family protein [Cryptosporangium arvum]EXG80002.1 CBS domain-containing protein [Cryptosporangium arvum DSM 44712]
MDSVGAQLALVLLLVLLNAAFAGSEIALISLRESQLQRLSRTGAGGRVLARLARDSNRFMATIQVGITLAGFLASATAAVSLAQPLVEPLSFLGNAARPVSIVVVTILLTFVTLVFGELAPKRIAMQRAEGWALAVARPLDLLSTLSRPAIWLLGITTDAVVRLLGGDPDRQREEVTREEVTEMVSSHKGFTPLQQTMIVGALEVGDRVLREVLVPRREAFVLSAEFDIPRARAALVASGHSRAPVAPRGSLDEAIGVVHLRQLIDDEGTLADRVLSVPALPGSMRVPDALRELSMARTQMALVVDEHGDIDGLVTVEDLVEEVVGEIYDETDKDIQAVKISEDGSMVLPGSFPVHDLVDIAIELPHRPEGDYTTVAGLILAVLGRIPRSPGDVVTVDRWSFEVRAVRRRAITEVMVRPEPDASVEPHELEEPATAE